MPRISPFAGLLFDSSVVGPLDRVTAPPYDVISSEEEARYRGDSPYNVVRLVLPREEPGDAEDEEKYRRASSYLGEWMAGGALVRDPEPRYYPYAMRFTLNGRPRRVRGLICQVKLEDWSGSIRPHEEVMIGPVVDRLRLMRANRTNLSPVYSVLSGPCEELREVLEKACAYPPTVAATDDEGVEHLLWSLPADEALQAALAGSPLMIADGHHRYTMALRYRDEMRERHGPGPWDHVMMLIVDAATEDPPVLPVHRLLATSEPAGRGTHVRDLQAILEAVSDDDLVYGTVVKQDGELLHRVASLQGHPPLVCAVHEQLLPGLGGEDGLRFTPDAEAAEAAVAGDEASAAILLPPTTAERIKAVVDGGQRLPQKSTYFWPKPRTGMVLRPVD